MDLDWHTRRVRQIDTLNTIGDPVAKIPELKVCAVQVEKVIPETTESSFV